MWFQSTAALAAGRLDRGDKRQILSRKYDPDVRGSRLCAEVCGVELETFQRA